MTSKHFIFSYGTLVNKRTRDKTGDSGEAIFCVLKGYQRRWNHANESGGFNAMGIQQADKAECIGMLIEIPYVELYKFDKRESGYRRIQLTADELFALSGKLPEGNYWLYVPLKMSLPTEKSPIPQSMVDVMVQAYLEQGGEDLVGRFFQTTEDWAHLVNDRGKPLYPRHLDGLPHERIDALLKIYLPSIFAERKEELAHLNPLLQASILKTIAWFDLFDFPLTAEEILEYLYDYKIPVHIKEMKGSLKQMTVAGQLNLIKEHYVLPGREKTVETRRARKFIAEKFWSRVRLYNQYLHAVPFVKMVAVCNNLAYDNASEASDIDLFIVVKPGRMWIARFLVTVILQFFGVRRHGEKIAGRFCLSFFVSENHLNIEPLALKPEDPYLAYWTVLLTPVYGLDAYQRFRKENEEWVEKKYGLKFLAEKTRHIYHLEKESFLKHFFERLLGGWLGNKGEAFLQSTFKKRTLRKMATLDKRANVIVTDDILKFHNHDKRKEYDEAWKKLILPPLSPSSESN